MKKKILDVVDSLSEFVVSHEAADTPILTVYANVDSTDPDNRRDRPAWLIELKNELKLLGEKHGTEALKRRDTRQRWDEAEEAILAHLRDRKAEGRSVVLFTDFEDYLTVDLPVNMPTALYYGTPQLKHLLFALDRYKKYLVILFSEEEARVIQVFLTAAAAEAQIPTGYERGIALRPGGSKARTQASGRRDLDSKRRLVADAAGRINDYFMGDPEFEHVVFGGNLKLAHAVKHALHPAVADFLVTIEPISSNSSNNDVAESVRRIADEVELEHDLALVNDLLSRQHACGRAVLERQGVVSALESGQASKLVVSVPMDTDEFDLLAIKALSTNAEIEFVHGEAAEKLNKFGGVGAVLYYTTA